MAMTINLPEIMIENDLGQMMKQFNTVGKMMFWCDSHHGV